MAKLLRFRKVCYVEPVKCSSLTYQPFETPTVNKKEDGAVAPTANNVLLDNKAKKNNNKKRREPKEWRCVDNCCWIIGYICTTWWLLVFLYSFLPSTLPGFQVPESAGIRLKREGLTALHPVVLVPGIVTGGLELWEGRPCAEGLFRKRLWGGSFTEVFRRFEILI